MTLCILSVILSCSKYGILHIKDIDEMYLMSRIKDLNHDGFEALKVDTGAWFRFMGMIHPHPKSGFLPKERLLENLIKISHSDKNFHHFIIADFLGSNNRENSRCDP